MSHTLYVIAVPIGNLKEITILAKEKLASLKTIFCEDTRVTRKLLTCLDIYNHQNLLCLNQFKEVERCEEICAKLDLHDCGLVSDAGYPVISDPGYFLIKKLRELKRPVQVINGPCAFIHAVVASGIDSRKLFWANFLSKKPIKRKEELIKLKELNRDATIVFYESSNFLLKGLKLMLDVFGDIKIGIAKELSKLNETIYVDLISVLINTVNTKGEFVIIIPQSDIPEEVCELDDVLSKIELLVRKKHIHVNDAIKLFKSKEFPSSLLYKEYIKKYKT